MFDHGLGIDLFQPIFKKINALPASEDEWVSVDDINERIARNEAILLDAKKHADLDETYAVSNILAELKGLLPSPPTK